ncbi:MAG: hypothetical protein NT069_08575 [Planctomycetota bacterium]|nr:hypothetical protein [Planctomycetota bacterium]
MPVPSDRPFWSPNVIRSLFCLLGVIALLTPSARAADRPLAEAYLHAGTFLEGETALRARLQQTPTDDEARFGLGALQFIHSVERLGQSLYRFGTAPQNGTLLALPFLRLPVPENPKPEVATHDGVRKIFLDMLADLKQAEGTLAEIKSPDVRLELRLGKIRLDLDGDGKADDPFEKIVTQYANQTNRQAPAIGDLDVAFDRGDVAWLRGYCHLLSALLEISLAHDHRELFENTGHLLFARVESPISAALVVPGRATGGFDYESIADLVAFIHLIHLPVTEPERMKSALDHLKQVFALSRESWKFILAEKDSDREWIPNPKQTGALRVPIRQDQVDSWLEFVNEAEAICEGKRLIPFWRGDKKRGVNLKRVFTEPRTFDLLLWMQGSAAVPYLEEGTPTDTRVWGRLERVFGGDFLTFGVWVN